MRLENDKYIHIFSLLSCEQDRNSELKQCDLRNIIKFNVNIWIEVRSQIVITGERFLEALRMRIEVLSCEIAYKL